MSQRALQVYLQNGMEARCDLREIDKFHNFVTRSFASGLRKKALSGVGAARLLRLRDAVPYAAQSKTAERR